MKGALTKLPHAVEALRTEVRLALQMAGLAVRQAVRVGQMLVEEREAVQHGAWLAWLKANVPEISGDTAERWMKAAENTPRLSGLEERLKGLGMPLSAVLGTPAEELPKAAAAVQLEMWEWMEGRTIRECYTGVLLDGDPAHRITRAANGKMLGGAGGDRKDWPRFVGEHLSDVSSHLKHWGSFSGAQMEVVETRVVSAVGKWPTPVLELFAAAIARELKRR